MKNLLICLVLSLALVGCATNPYKMFYTDSMKIDVLKNPTVIIPSKDPELYGGDDFGKDAMKMEENNYDLIGYSSFCGPLPPDSLAIAKGRELHAAVVVIDSMFMNSQSGAMPLTLPNVQTSNTQGMIGSTPGSFQTTTYGTQTTYMPFIIDRYDTIASFWIKGQPPILGIIYSDLTPEAKMANMIQEPVTAKEPDNRIKIDETIHDLQRKLNKMNNSNMELEGILYDKACPRAVINDTIVKVGDTIEGAKVTKIEKKNVVLSLGNTIITLKLE